MHKRAGQKKVEFRKVWNYCDISKDQMQNRSEKAQLHLDPFVQYNTPLLEKRATCIIFGWTHSKH